MMNMMEMYLELVADVHLVFTVNALMEWVDDFFSQTNDVDAACCGMLSWNIIIMVL
jgi:hypothetical protein